MAKDKNHTHKKRKQPLARISSPIIQGNKELEIPSEEEGEDDRPKGSECFCFSTPSLGDFICANGSCH